MNALLVLASLVAFSTAAPSGIWGGAGLIGPAGIVTGVGPLGLGGGAILTAPSAGALISGPALGLAAVPLGAGVITNGGGTIGVSGAGAAIRGPGTAPVVVAGPSGKIAADGLWGPTANIGLGGLGKGW